MEKFLLILAKSYKFIAIAIPALILVGMVFVMGYIVFSELYTDIVIKKNWELVYGMLYATIGMIVVIGIGHFFGFLFNKAEDYITNHQGE